MVWGFLMVPKFGVARGILGGEEGGKDLRGWGTHQEVFISGWSREVCWGGMRKNSIPARGKVLVGVPENLRWRNKLDK